MPPKGRKNLDIDVDPDLLRGTLQTQAQQSQSSKPKQRQGPSIPAAQPGPESGQSAPSVSQLGNATPRGTGRSQTQTHKSNSLPRRKRPGFTFEVDPDLVASTTQPGRATPTQSERQSHTTESTVPTPRVATESNVQTGPATPTWRPGAPIPRHLTPTTSRPLTSSAAQAGHYSTPSARNHGSRFASSSLRKRVIAKNYLEDDDIEDTSPEAKSSRRSTTQPSINRPVSRAASILSQRHGSRASSSRPQPELPSLIGSGPIRATNAMEIDDDSIHSSSPPERISESVSPRKAQEVAVKLEIESEDDDTATIVPEREIRDSQDEDSDESQADPGVQFITETTTGLRLDPSAAQTQKGEPKKQPQFRKPPKFTFKNDKIPKDRAQFNESPIFTFKSRFDPQHRPNPWKYKFKEDIRPPTESPPPVPEEEPEPEPQSEETNQPEKKKKNERRSLLKAHIPDGLAGSLRKYMIYANNTLSERAAVANSGNHLVEVKLVQHMGNNRFNYWLVRGRVMANNLTVHLLLPGNGWHAWPEGEYVDEVVYNPITPGCTIGCRGSRWKVNLEKIKWIIVPDWFVVRETEAQVRRNVHYGQDYVT